MPVTTDITTLSTTAASNSPAGTEDRTTTDDYLRQIHAFIATLYADKAALTIPSVTTTGLTAGTTHKGKCLSTSGDITVPNSTFVAGDVFSVYNNSASAVSIIQGSGVTLRLGGSTTTGSRTLAARGMATVWFNGASEAIVSGAGVS